MFAVVLSRADGTPEALAAVRALAKDALEAVRAAPERDTSFEDLLAPLIDPKSKPDLAEIRRLLVEFTKPLVKRMS